MSGPGGFHPTLHFSHLFGPPPPDILFPHLWNTVRTGAERHSPSHTPTSESAVQSTSFPFDEGQSALNHSSFSHRHIFTGPLPTFDLEVTNRMGPQRTVSPHSVSNSSGKSFSVEQRLRAQTGRGNFYTGKREYCGHSSSIFEDKKLSSGEKTQRLSRNLESQPGQINLTFGSNGKASSTSIHNEWNTLNYTSDPSLRAKLLAKKFTKQTEYRSLNVSKQSDLRKRSKASEDEEDEPDDDEDEEANELDLNSKSGQNVECVVCGDKSSGKHYGQHTCEGCKSFFKRSVRRKLTYTCRGTRQCPIDVHHRNQCQYCRFQKCVRAGMRKEAVQQGRLPSYPLIYNSYYGTASYLSPMATAMNCMNNLNVSNFYAQFLTMLLRAEPVAHRHSQVSLAYLRRTGSEWLCLPTKSDNDPREKNLKLSHEGVTCQHNTNGESAEKEREKRSNNCDTDFAIRVILASVEWAKNIPLFTGLPLHDQLSLIQNAWPELFVINVAQASTPCTPEGFRSHNSPELFEATPAGTNNQGLCFNLSPNRKSPCSQEGIDSTRSNSKEEIPSTSELVDRFQDQVDRLRMLQLDMAEFVSLKGILLFNAEAPGLCDSATVECIQEKIQSALEEYDRGQFSHNQPFRFGRLLLRLPRLRQVTGEWIKRLFFPHCDKHVSVEQLIREVLYHGPPPVGSNGIDQPTVLDLSPESNTIPVGTLTSGIPQCTPEKPEGFNYHKTNYHSATAERLLNTSGSSVRPLLTAERKYSDPLRGIRSIPISTDLPYVDQNPTSKNVPFPFPLMYTSFQHPLQRCLEHNFVRSMGHHAKDVNFTANSGLQHHQSRPPDSFSTAIRTRTGCNPHAEFKLGMPLPRDPVTCLSTEAVEKAFNGITTTMSPVGIDSKNTSLLSKNSDGSVLFDSIPSSTAPHVTALQLYYAVMRQQLQMLHKRGLPAWSDNVTEALASVTSPTTPTVHPNTDSSGLSKI
ncbi:hypothetical protein CRM22_001145 [Opisthorchis felineus]|uniref:Nuclear receptor domain-containing protein n=1 Tax=Opisthorchis felineus TaxID=147828 RepID=A0A4S2MBX0_OPIFE|nr:hypothetical protein CRM22_001145 [Opisthorchis felineus]